MASDPSGPARDLGTGWKCRPHHHSAPDETPHRRQAPCRACGSAATLGATSSFYWDDQVTSVECP